MEDDYGKPEGGIRGTSEKEAIEEAIEYLYEMCGCNSLYYNFQDGRFEVSSDPDEEPFEYYDNFRAIKLYKLIDANGKEYWSETPGKFGGHSKLKIYGKLDCPSAARYIAKGQYVQYRVFFLDEETAISAGYRPCGVCMKEQYKKWKENKLQINTITN